MKRAPESGVHLLLGEVAYRVEPLTELPSQSHQTDLTVD